LTRANAAIKGLYFISLLLKNQSLKNLPFARLHSPSPLRFRSRVCSASSQPRSRFGSALALKLVLGIYIDIVILEVSYSNVLGLMDLATALNDSRSLRDGI
jgi:hypothetical protein